MKSTHIQVQKLDARVCGNCNVLDMIIQFNSREETKKNEKRKKKVNGTRNFLFALCDHNAAACFLCACWLNGLYFAFCHVKSGTWRDLNFENKIRDETAECRDECLFYTHNRKYTSPFKGKKEKGFYI